MDTLVNDLKFLRQNYIRRLDEAYKLPERNLNNFICNIRVAKIRELKKRLRRTELSLEKAILEESYGGK